MVPTSENCQEVLAKQFTAAEPVNQSVAEAALQREDGRGRPEIVIENGLVQEVAP